MNKPAKGIVVDHISSDLKKVMRQLKLSPMLDTLPERLSLARQQHLSHAAFLELVLADEATRRDTTSATRRARCGDARNVDEEFNVRVSVRVYDESDQLVGEQVAVRINFVEAVGLCLRDRAASDKPAE